MGSSSKASTPGRRTKDKIKSRSPFNSNARPHEQSVPSRVRVSYFHWCVRACRRSRLGGKVLHAIRSLAVHTNGLVHRSPRECLLTGVRSCTWNDCSPASWGSHCVLDVEAPTWIRRVRLGLEASGGGSSLVGGLFCGPRPLCTDLRAPAAQCAGPQLQSGVASIAKLNSSVPTPYRPSPIPITDNAMPRSA